MQNFRKIQWIVIENFPDARTDARTHGRGWILRSQFRLKSGDQKPHVNIFIRCRDITERRFPPRNTLRNKKHNSSKKHNSVTSEMTSQYFPPFEKEKFKACMVFVYIGKWLATATTSPSEKCPGVGFHKLPPASMEDEAAPSFARCLQVARGRTNQSLFDSLFTCGLWTRLDSKWNIFPISGIVLFFGHTLRELIFAVYFFEHFAGNNFRGWCHSSDFAVEV